MEKKIQNCRNSRIFTNRLCLGSDIFFHDTQNFTNWICVINVSLKKYFFRSGRWYFRLTQYDVRITFIHNYVGLFDLFWRINGKKKYKIVEIPKFSQIGYVWAAISSFMIHKTSRIGFV